MATGNFGSLTLTRSMDFGRSDPQIMAYSCRQCGSVTLSRTGRRCCGEEMDPIDVTATNEPDVGSLVSQVFGISQTGVEICVYIAENGEVTIRDIATEFGIDRSTVNRQLDQLREVRFVERHETALKEGGRVHHYSLVSPEKRHHRRREAFMSWVADALGLLDEIDERKLEAVAEHTPSGGQPQNATGDE